MELIDGNLSIQINDKNYLFKTVKQFIAFIKEDTAAAKYFEDAKFDKEYIQFTAQKASVEELIEIIKIMPTALRFFMVSPEIANLIAQKGNAQQFFQIIKIAGRSAKYLTVSTAIGEMIAKSMKNEKFIDYFIEIFKEEPRIAIQFTQSPAIGKLFAKQATVDQFRQVVRMGGAIAQHLASSPEIQKFIATKATIKQLIEIANEDNIVTDNLFWLQNAMNAMVETLSHEMVTFIAEKATVEQFIEIAKLHPEIAKKLVAVPEIKKSLITEKGTVKQFLEIDNISPQVAQALTSNPKTMRIAYLPALVKGHFPYFSLKENDLKQILSLKISDTKAVAAESHKIFSSLLKAFIREGKAPQEVIDACTMISKFLASDKELFFQNMDRLSIAIELFQYVIKDKYVDQKNSSLCGIASLTSALITNDSKLFVELALTLAENGTTTPPTSLTVHHNSKMANFEIVTALIHAIRHSTNVLGYPGSRSLGFFETYSGVTTPEDMTNLLERFGFKVNSESILLKDFKGDEANVVHRFILGGLYSNYHNPISTKPEKINDIMHINHGGGAIMLVAKLPPGNKLKFPATTVYGIELTHYIYIHKFEMDKTSDAEDVINIEYETYGQKYTAKWPINDFIEAYRGTISFMKPPPSPSPSPSD